jgi:hypothetical protein
MPTKTTLKTVLWTLAALAVVNRVQAAKDVINGDSSWF